MLEFYIAVIIIKKTFKSIFFGNSIKFTNSVTAGDCMLGKQCGAGSYFTFVYYSCNIDKPTHQQNVKVVTLYHVAVFVSVEMFNLFILLFQH